MVKHFVLEGLLLLLKYRVMFTQFNFEDYIEDAFLSLSEESVFF